MNLSPAVRYLLRYLALSYLLVLLVVPVGLILWRTFSPGFGAFSSASSGRSCVDWLMATSSVADTGYS